MLSSIISSSISGIISSISSSISSSSSSSSRIIISIIIIIVSSWQSSHSFVPTFFQDYQTRAAAERSCRPPPRLTVVSNK